MIRRILRYGCHLKGISEIERKRTTRRFLWVIQAWDINNDDDQCWRRKSIRYDGGQRARLVRFVMPSSIPEGPENPACYSVQ